MRRIWLVLIVSTLLACPTLASAGDNDFKLHRLAEFNCQQTDPNTGRCTSGVAEPDLEGFKEFSRHLGMVFAPSFLSPAESLGEAGFAVGFETKFSSASSGDYWDALNGVEEGETDAPLFTLLQLHARKGLPFSFEIDGLMSWLVDSELFYIGGGVKWSLNEGWTYIPDLAVRGHGGTVAGNSDMSLTTAGVDVSLSKAFGVAGFLNLTPYAGYSHVWVISSSRVIDADPESGRTPTGGYAPEFVFTDPEDNDSTITQNAPRGFVGLRMVLDYFTFTFEGNWSAEVQNYAFNLGADF